MTTDPKETADKLTSTAHDAAGSAVDTAAAVSEHVSNAVEDFRQNDTVTGIVKKITEFRHEHPRLAIAAVALIVGGVLVALARRSRH